MQKFILIIVPIIIIGIILKTSGYKIHFFKDEPYNYRYISAGNIYFNMTKYCDSIKDTSDKMACESELNRFMDNKWSNRK